jgi:hypothetical protein
MSVHIKQGFLAQRSRSPISAETICAKLLSTTVEDRKGKFPDLQSAMLQDPSRTVVRYPAPAVQRPPRIYLGLWMLMGDGGEMRRLFEDIDGSPFEEIYSDKSLHPNKSPQMESRRYLQITFSFPRHLPSASTDHIVHMCGRSVGHVHYMVCGC